MDGAANARHPPNPTAMTKSGHTAVGSDIAYKARAIEQISSPVTASDPTILRLKRSATDPVTRTNNAAGRNSASPSRPMSSSRPVMSYTCLPRAVACNITPAFTQTLDPSTRRTDACRSRARLL